MVKLTRAFKLFQPWADEVVCGAMPFLIRTINTKKRERVGVLAINKMDNIWINNADRIWVKSIQEQLNIGLIGSVEIQNTIKINKSEAESKLIKLGGKKYSEYYPLYLIPDSKNLYIWILKNPNKWKYPEKINSIVGHNWIKIDIIDKNY